MPMTQSFRERLFPRLPEIIERFGTPFHIYDLKGILETGNAMKEAFQRTPYRNYFAVKALPNPWILQALYNKLYFGFDCSSVPELALARKVGAISDDIMFTSNNTSSEEFLAAKQEGGCLLNLDDVSLIPEVPGHFPKTICFRINPGKSRTGNSIIGDPYNSKYGITLDQVVPAYRQAMERGAIHFGMHTMICSNERKASYMVETVRMLLGLCLLLKNRLGLEVEFINMGGGFGIPYKPGQKTLRLNWMANHIVSLLEKFELDNGWRPKLLSECGRYVTGPHGVLVSRVINEKKTYRRYLGVDTGMPALMRPAMYDAYHKSDILDEYGRPVRGPLQRMSIVGSICENCDRLATNRLLPKNARRGNIVVTHDTGAHGIAMGFNYNGRLRPQELLMVSGGEIVQIRRAEIQEDLFRTIIEPPGWGQPVL